MFLFSYDTIWRPWRSVSLILWHHNYDVRSEMVSATMTSMAKCFLPLWRTSYDLHSEEFFMWQRCHTTPYHDVLHMISIAKSFSCDKDAIPRRAGIVKETPSSRQWTFLDRLTLVCKTLFGRISTGIANALAGKGELICCKRMKRQLQGATARERTATKPKQGSFDSDLELYLCKPPFLIDFFKRQPSPSPP